MEKNGYLDSQNKLLRKVADTVARHGMVSRGDAVLIGASGGPDSTALAHCMARLAKRLGIERIGIAHLNHCLRGKESDEDNTFTERLAKSLGFPFYDKKTDVMAFSKNAGRCLEDAARELRYDFFISTAEKHGYNKIATAHHAADNAELVLMNMIRGAGPDGLSGIPPARRVKNKDIVIIRPFIQIEKDEILRFLRLEKIGFRTDSSNLDQSFLRNRVRSHLLPLLKEQYNPAVEDALNRLSVILREESQWIEEIVSSLLESALLETKEGSIRMSAPFLRSLPTGAQRRLFRMAVEKTRGSTQKISFTHADAVCRCLESGHPFSLDLPEGIKVVGDQGVVAINLKNGPGSTGKVGNTAEFCHTLFADGFKDETFTIEETGDKISFKVLTPNDIPAEKRFDSRIALLDIDRLAAPLTIRSIRPGDRFTPLGMQGSQKISDFFINSKVPKEARKSCPVLVCGDRIVWVAGYRIAENAKITDKTTRVLMASINKAQTE